MSYRRGWQLLWSVNMSFRVPVVVTATGGRGGRGARVTPFGRELISSYRACEHDAQTRAVTAFRAIADKRRRGAGGAPRFKVRLRSRQTDSELQE
jgi:molybdate transport system regulatory protein